MRRIKVKDAKITSHQDNITEIALEDKDHYSSVNNEELLTSWPKENFDNMTLDQIEIKSVKGSSNNNSEPEDDDIVNHTVSNDENADFIEENKEGEQDFRICDEVFLSFWLSFYAKVQENARLPVIDNFSWLFLYRQRAEKAVEFISMYWKYARKDRQFFVSAQKITRLMQPKIREFIRKKAQEAEEKRLKRILDEKIRAVVRIQKVYKGFKVYKKYKREIEERMKMRKHKEFLEKQATLRKARTHKKQAVRIIEDHWTIYMNKKKMKEVRKYLWTLPYECRLLYFKFQQVKQDADNLKTDVDLLIAKKQGKIT